MFNISHLNRDVGGERKDLCEDLLLRRSTCRRTFPNATPRPLSPILYTSTGSSSRSRHLDSPPPPRALPLCLRTSPGVALPLPLSLPVSHRASNPRPLPCHHGGSADARSRICTDPWNARSRERRRAGFHRLGRLLQLDKSAASLHRAEEALGVDWKVCEPAVTAARSRMPRFQYRRGPHGRWRRPRACRRRLLL